VRAVRVSCEKFRKRKTVETRVERISLNLATRGPLRAKRAVSVREQEKLKPNKATRIITPMSSVTDDSFFVYVVLYSMIEQPYRQMTRLLRKYLKNPDH
jgi:hypothetical protein